MGETESGVSNWLLANGAYADLSHGGPDSGAQVFLEALGEPENLCGLDREGRSEI